MGNLADWMGVAHLGVALLALVYAPGYLLLRAGRFSRTVSLALAPANTFLIVGAAGVIFDIAGVTWGLMSLSVATAMLIIVAFGLGHISAPGPVRSFSFARGQSAMDMRRVSISAVLSVVLLVVPVIFLADPAVPSFQGDPMFHYNGTNAIVQTGNASMLTAMAPQYGIQAWEVVYPTVWHALIALLGDVASIPANHVLAYIVVPIISTVSLVFLARTSLPSNPATWYLAPIVAFALPYFPNFLTVSRGFWPNSLALSAVPAVLGLIVLAVRNGPATRLAEIGFTGIAVVLALAGIAFAHPGAAFAAIWPLLPTVLICSVAALWTTVRDRKLTRERAIVLAGNLIIGAGVAVVTLHPHLRLFLHRDHPRSWNTAERLATFTSEISNIPPLLVIALAIGAIAIVVAFGAAVSASWSVPASRWLVVAWFTQLSVVFGSYVDGNVLSGVAGIWYHDPKRAMATLSIFTSIIGALLIDRWIHRHPRHGRHLVIAVLAVSLAIGIGTRLVSVYPDARAPIGPNRMIDSANEIAFLDDLNRYVPSQGIILGDPTSGIGYAPAYADVNVVYPQVNGRDIDKDGGYLRMNFRNIHDDPHVCKILTEYGIEYFYEDDPLVYQKRDRAETWPGLYGVDTSKGFTKLAQTDGGTLWRIDACGPMGEPDWWDLEARIRPVPKAAPPRVEDGEG